MSSAARPETRTPPKGWTPPHAERGDIVVVESPPRSGKFIFGVASVAPGGDLIAYRHLGKVDLPNNWMHRHTYQRYSVVLTGTPTDAEEAQRRTAFRDAVGALAEPVRTGEVQRLLDLLKPA